MNRQELRNLLSQAEEDNNTEPIIYENQTEEEIEKPYDEWYGSKLAALYLDHAERYFRNGQLKDAEQYYWKAYRTYDSIYDDDLDESLNTIAVLLMLTNFYISTCRLWKALNTCQKASKQYNQLGFISKEHPYWSWGLDIIILKGRIYAKAGNEEMAQYHYEEACNYLQLDAAA